MNDLAWRRYVIMNTTTAPAYLQCKVEKIASKLTPIDLSTIVEEEEKSIEEIVQEANK